MPEGHYERLIDKAAKQLASEGQIDLCLYAEIEEAGFDVNTIVDAADDLNATINPQ